MQFHFGYCKSHESGMRPFWHRRHCQLFTIGYYQDRQLPTVPAWSQASTWTSDDFLINGLQSIIPKGIWQEILNVSLRKLRLQNTQVHIKYQNIFLDLIHLIVPVGTNVLGCGNWFALIIANWTNHMSHISSQWIPHFAVEQLCICYDLYSFRFCCSAGYPPTDICENANRSAMGILASILTQAKYEARW